MIAQSAGSVLEDQDVTLIRGDAARVLSQYPDTIDLTITSPPYNLGKDYATSTDTTAYGAYLDWTRQWLQALYHATRSSGRLCLNVPLDTNKGGKRASYADFIGIARDVGWQYHTSIVWNENNISRRTAWGSWRSPSAPFVTAPVEMIGVFFKDTWRRPAAGRTPTISAEEFKTWTLGLWTFSGESAKRVGHPAPFPVELPRRLIQLYSYAEDRVCDPFMGAGSTGLACLAAGRPFLGIDIASEYVALSEERLRRQLESR